MTPINLVPQHADLRNRWVLITGASAGIGLACAELLAARGCHLILAARRNDRLATLAERLIQMHGIQVQTVTVDVAQRDSVDAAFSTLGARLGAISILINNAGLALGTELLQNASPDDWDAMIDTNIKGLLLTTKLCLPGIKNHRGHIINLGSVAGRWVYPGGAVYCASKFAVRAITEGLRMDLLGSGVRVTNIAPGMVETEFSKVRFRGDEDKASAVYRGMTPLNPLDVAEAVVWSLERPGHVNIQELVIYPTDQASVGAPYVHRHNP